MLDIPGLMASLSNYRPIFHSEADFQHALAWQIHKDFPAYEVRLEFNSFSSQESQMYLDIWLPTMRIAIELKYPTRKLQLELESEIFALRDQSAQDTRRYDFCRDIERLERVVSHGLANSGYAVLLTNDPLYWRTAPKMTNDDNFRIHQGRELAGSLAWSERASAGTKRGREQPIHLQGRYMLEWQDYVGLEAEGPSQFRYLAVAVGPAQVNFDNSIVGAMSREDA